MRRFGLPVLPLIVGAILGPLFEKHLRRSLQGTGGDASGLIGGPVSWVCYGIVLVVLLWPLIARLRRVVDRGVDGAGGSDAGGSGPGGTGGSGTPLSVAASRAPVASSRLPTVDRASGESLTSGIPKVAVALRLAVMTTVQAPVDPAQSPVQPRSEPVSMNGVRRTLVPGE